MSRGSIRRGCDMSSLQATKLGEPVYARLGYESHGYESHGPIQMWEAPPIAITGAMAVWLVPLPRGAEPPYQVWVNGVEQKEGDDYSVTEGGLAFSKPLEKERIGIGRWAPIFLGLWGSYGKNDSVDVRYSLHGERRLATGLEIVPPSVP